MIYLYEEKGWSQIAMFRYKPHFNHLKQTVHELIGVCFFLFSFDLLGQLNVLEISWCTIDFKRQLF